MLVLSGRKRSAKLESVTHGGRQEGPELPAAAAAVLEPEPGKKKNWVICLNRSTQNLAGTLNNLTTGRGHFYAMFAF